MRDLYIYTIMAYKTNSFLTSVAASGTLVAISKMEAKGMAYTQMYETYPTNEYYSHQVIVQQISGELISAAGYIREEKDE